MICLSIEFLLNSLICIGFYMLKSFHFFQLCYMLNVRWRIKVVNLYVQVHCLQFLICELVSGGNLRKPGGLFGNSGSGISVEDLKQLETFFYKLGFFLHIIDYKGAIFLNLFLRCFWIALSLILFIDFIDKFTSVCFLIS